MTKKEKVFRHIEDNGNAMRYTDIIRFAYENTYGVGKFDKRKNRGFYASAFQYHSYWSAQLGDRRKNIGAPKGHFVIPTKNGHLVKLSNGLWSVHRPHGWVRSEVNCETYETRIEKFLSDGKSVTEREIVSHIKPYVVERRRKIGYDWGNTNNLLRKMIEKGKVSRVVSVNSKTGRPAYHYFAVNTQTDATKNIESKVSIPADEYESMCSGLSIYGITSDQFDVLATKYYYDGNDIASAYSYAYYDLLNQHNLISDTTKELQNEIDSLSTKIVVNDSNSVIEQKYIVINDGDLTYEGIFTMSQLEDFFIDNDTEDYTIIEAGNTILLEKNLKVTLTIKK